MDALHTFVQQIEAYGNYLLGKQFDDYIVKVYRMDNNTCAIIKYVNGDVNSAEFYKDKSSL